MSLRVGYPKLRFVESLTGGVRGIFPNYLITVSPSLPPLSPKRKMQKSLPLLLLIPRTQQKRRRSNLCLLPLPPPRPSRLLTFSQPPTHSPFFGLAENHQHLKKPYGSFFHNCKRYFIPFTSYEKQLFQNEEFCTRGSSSSWKSGLRGNRRKTWKELWITLPKKRKKQKKGPLKTKNGLPTLFPSRPPSFQSPRPGWKRVIFPNLRLSPGKSVLGRAPIWETGKEETERVCSCLSPPPPPPCH